MKPDGPTMSTEEIWEAALKQRVVAQREHKAKYRGNPGTPLTIKPERRHTKPATKSDHPHHWLIPEPNGSRYLTGVCKTCGAEREYKAADDGEPTPMRKMRL